MATREKDIVNVIVSDRVIHNLSDSLIQFVSVMRADKDLLINFNTEGPSIEELTYRVRDNFLDLLDKLCDEMNYDKKRITLITGNLIEPTTRFKVEKQNSAKGWFYGEHLAKIELDHNKEFKYNFGNFVSNSTYPRLLLASHLHTHHKNKTMQTYRRDPKNPGQAVDLDLDKLMFECADPVALNDVTRFVQHLPIELEHELAEHPMTNLSAGEDGDAINKTILSWYRNFFCDVVTETFFSGKTFFLTEKTTRPLLCMNPFIVHGPVDYLKNLRAMGFKTFSKYWSEGYDHLHGYARCKEMYKVISQISKMDINKIHRDMQPDLEHNRRHLLSLNDDYMRKFIDGL
jgi:hypothetical protein